MDFTMAALWLLATLVVFAIPFIPVWQELRNPGDIEPLKISRNVRQQGTNVLGPTHEWPQLSEMVDVAALPRNSVGDIRLTARLPHVHAHHGDSLIVASRARVRALSCDETVYLEKRARVSDALFARRIYCLGKLRLPRLTEAQFLLSLAPGVTFMRVHARMIATALDLEAGNARDLPPVAAPTQRDLLHEDWHVESGSTIEGNYVVRGDWSCGSDVQIRGSIKVHGKVFIGERTVLDGNLFALQSIDCAQGVFITGHVSSQDKVHIARQCQIGTARRPVQIIGSIVTLAPEVRIFGGVSTMYGGTVQA